MILLYSLITLIANTSEALLKSEQWRPQLEGGNIITLKEIPFKQKLLINLIQPILT